MKSSYINHLILSSVAIFYLFGYMETLSCEGKKEMQLQLGGYFI